MPLWAWDFENNTWQISVPGYEYVEGASFEGALLPTRSGAAGGYWL
jgi:hypothetical protein